MKTTQKYTVKFFDAFNQFSHMGTYDDAQAITHHYCLYK